MSRFELLKQKQHDPAGIYADFSSLIEMRAIAKDIRLNRRKFKSRSIIDGGALAKRRGRGMEFAEVRPYQAGDDIRTIDWRVTARTQETYTKLFQEEKERPVYVLTDQRSPMYFGSKLQFKSYLAARISALYVWAAVQNNDNVGAILFGDETQSDFRPKRGKNAALRILSALAEINTSLTQKAAPSMLSLSAMLGELRRIARPGSSIFIISDFHDFDADCEREMSILARHSEIDALHIFDPLETELPQNTLLPAFGHGANNRQATFTINTYNKTLRENFVHEWQQLQAQVQSCAHRLNANYRALSTALPAKQHIRDLLAGNSPKNNETHARQLGGEI